MAGKACLSEIREMQQSHDQLIYQMGEVQRSTNDLPQMQTDDFAPSMHLFRSVWNFLRHDFFGRQLNSDL